MEIKTRMAPSPTGEYHVGHIRTLLYNYAFAKQSKGTFLLRIEDTDRTRFVEGATERIMNVIHDLGFEWDEGPYYQSERLDIYKKHAEELVASGKAYYCFCSSERLDVLRQEQQSTGVSPKYDGLCSHLTPEEVSKKLASGESSVIRLKMPKNTDVKFSDVVYGDITINTDSLDDQVLLKSDGFPTYHLAVVVDDHLMNVTHIMRGNDWLPSTPKHVLLYDAFGWEKPIYIHLPNLKEEGGTKKLSKRFGSVTVAEFLEEGYLPDALINFLMFLGWNPGTDKEIYTVEEFSKDFNIHKIQKTDLVTFDRKKLSWFNGVYIRNMPSAELLIVLREYAVKYNKWFPKDSSDSILISILDLIKDRMRLLSEFKDLSSYFLDTPVINSDLVLSQASNLDETKSILSTYIDTLGNVIDEDWTSSKLDELCHAQLEKMGFTPKKAFMTLRVSLAGVTNTPPLFDVMCVLGKTQTLVRLKENLVSVEKK